MKRFKIVQEPEICIGCGACVAVCPARFEMGDDGKAHLKGATKKNELGTKGVTYSFVLEVDDAGDIQQAADVCPVVAVHIEKNK